jgi:hypothetical protein
MFGLFGGRTYGLSADFIYVKFIRHDLKVTHSRRICDCLLINNIFIGKLMIFPLPNFSTSSVIVAINLTAKQGPQTLYRRNLGTLCSTKKAL